MPRYAIDTVILVHAAGLRKMAKADGLRERCLDCKHLLESTSELNIPAPVITEAMRTIIPAEADQLTLLLRKRNVLTLTPPAALIASRLLKIESERKGRCERCGELSGKQPCPECGLVRGAQTSVVDAMIAGCVLAQPGNWVLYTYNTRHFCALLAGQDRVTIEEPPRHDASLPLIALIESTPPLEAAEKM